jgi:hypothetical protein
MNESNVCLIWYKNHSNSINHFEMTFELFSLSFVIYFSSEFPYKLISNVLKNLVITSNDFLPLSSILLSFISTVYSLLLEPIPKHNMQKSFVSSPNLLSFSICMYSDAVSRIFLIFWLNFYFTFIVSMCMISSIIRALRFFDSNAIRSRIKKSKSELANDVLAIENSSNLVKLIFEMAYKIVSLLISYKFVKVTWV